MTLIEQIIIANRNLKDFLEAQKSLHETLKNNNNTGGK